ncbi:MULTISPECIES: mechanosensitive ion channel family protein [unclassified Nocardioides]|uniref:mechanosensitive ion channel family protein n=1 Tax=unclassified Nocardioides TaxID=2615069 RepID=UPI0030145679
MATTASAWAVDVPVVGLDLSVSSVLWGAAIAVATALVARYAARATLHLGHRVQGVADDLALQAARVVRYFVILVGAGVVLAILGAPVQPLLAAVLLVVGAAFLMLRGIADNFGAALVIQTRHPVRLGDLVESGGHRGHVADLNSRSVVLAALDGRTVHIPNRMFMDEPLVNHSTRGAVRSEVQVRIAHPEPGPATGEALVATAAGVRGVLPSPAPHVLLVAVDADRVTYALRFWHHPDAGPQVASHVTAALHQDLVAAGRPAALAWPPPDAPLTSPGDL